MLEKASGCIFGLTSSIYSTNRDIIMRALNELHYGETYVNREHFEAFRGFHAGVRQSGPGGDDANPAWRNPSRPTSAARTMT